MNDESCQDSLRDIEVPAVEVELIAAGTFAFAALKSDGTVTAESDGTVIF